MNKINAVFEQEAQGKALFALAERGEWDSAMTLSDKLSTHAWHRRGLMGQSAEEVGFLACWKGCGIPDSKWLGSPSVGNSSLRFQRLQELAAKEAKREASTPDRARHALEWLAWCVPSLGYRGAFDFMSQSESKLWGLDVTAWAEAMLTRAKEGSLGKVWRGSEDMWAMAGSLEGNDAKRFAEAFMDSGLLPILGAARSGALTVAQSAIKRLDANEALALFVAALCSYADWNSFELALGAQPESDLAEHWRTLVVNATGLKDRSFESLGVGSSWTELTRGHLGTSSGERWDSAMKALAIQAVPALLEPGMSAARVWVLSKAPGWARNLFAPASKSVSEWNLSDLPAEKLLLDLSKIVESKNVWMESDVRAAARRLWDLRVQSLLSSDKSSRGNSYIQEAAAMLWRAPEPKAFLAFAQELALSAGGQAESAFLCGFPSPTLHNEFTSRPGSPGHAIALVLAFPPDCMDQKGNSVWMRPEGQEYGIRWLWERFATGAQLGMMKAGAWHGWSTPLPEALPPMSQWANLDLDSTKWKGLVEGPSAALGWEGAFEAIGQLARAIGAPSEMGRPPEPNMKKGGGDLPTRMAWSQWAWASPRAAAQWVGDNFLGPSESRLKAERVLTSLSEESKKSLARALPEAFEAACVFRANVNSGLHLMDIADACRSAGRLLATPSSTVFAPDEVICAALLCASGYGVSRLLASKYESDLDFKNLKGMARELALVMPQAATAMMAVGFDSEGSVPGFNGPDLAGKAVWGSLALGATWWVGPDGDMTGSAWSERWEGIELDPKNQWTNSCLSALFTPSSLSRDGGAGAGNLLDNAYEWLQSFGANGLGRLPGERSAIERAVDSRFYPGVKSSHSEESCFGASMISKLVQLGADPSDASAPQGVDAFALCTAIERSSSPSSVMKVLIKSPKAKLGRGVLLSRLSTSNALSPKIVETLAHMACMTVELESLAYLGLQAEHSNLARNWINTCLIQSTEARAGAQDGLISKMISLNDSAKKSSTVLELMKSHGVEPSIADKRAMLEKGILGNSKSCSLDNIRGWVSAGASKAPIDLALLSNEFASACLDAGLGDTVWAADVLMARALSVLVDIRSGSACKNWAKAAQELSDLGYGSPLAGVVAEKLLLKERSISDSLVLLSSLGPENYAKLENLVLKTVSSIANQTCTPSKRL